MLEEQSAGAYPTEKPIPAAVAELHERCGVYTNAAMVGRILDSIGWLATNDLASLRLLEPAAGDGAFVIEAAHRLVTSAARRGNSNWLSLAGCILSFELHEGEATKARAGIVAALVAANLPEGVARELAEKWVVTGDFLLQPLVEGSFSHVAGNPPYCRWSKIPQELRKQYESALPKETAKGDLFLPFLDRGIAVLRTGGRLGFLCSDRWRHMAFAEDFRRNRLPLVSIHEDTEVSATDVYRRNVDIYPSVLVLERLRRPARSSPRSPTGKTLTDLGFEVRVGPALGCTDAFVVPVGAMHNIEAELLAPWVDARGVHEGGVVLDGRTVICMYDEDGRLRNPKEFPKAEQWLISFRSRLENRSIVKNHGAEWFRPIDKVQARRWRGPKILLPELAKVPRVALDLSGAVPSHGVYAIMPQGADADIEALYHKLANGGLARTLEGRAPKVKGAYIRCYRKILCQIEIN